MLSGLEPFTAEINTRAVAPRLAPNSAYFTNFCSNVSDGKSIAANAAAAETMADNEELKLGVIN